MFVLRVFDNYMRGITERKCLSADIHDSKWVRGVGICIKNESNEMCYIIFGTKNIDKTHNNNLDMSQHNNQLKY